MANYAQNSYEMSRQSSRQLGLLTADESADESGSQYFNRSRRSSSVRSVAATTSNIPLTYQPLPAGFGLPSQVHHPNTLDQESSNVNKLWEDFSTSYAFAILSIVGLAIVIINFLQLGLLDHLSNSKWINILPGVTLAFGILVFTCYILYAKNWKTARSKWNDADWKQRVAWIGVILSILLPILICEFVYLNAWALPKYHKKTWTADLNFESTLRAPSLLMIAFKAFDRLPQAVFTANGSCYYDPNGHCNENMTWNKTYSNIEYHLFNSSSPRVPLGPGANVVIYNPLTWNSSGNTIEPYLYYALIDGELLQDLDSILPYIGGSPGGCSLFDAQYVPVMGTNYITVEPYKMDDAVGALQSPEIPAACAKHTNYTYYRNSINHFAYTDRSTCDVGSHNFTGPCMSATHISFATNMVTTQQSKHGTDWMQMLTDEGSIAGGIMFFTWFLGIYVL